MDEALIVLSPASDADYEFSYQVKKAAEGDLIRKVFGWNEAFQRGFHLKEWLEKRPHIIRYDGVSIGTISVQDIDGSIEIGQFFILPKYQNKGVGSAVLHRVLQRADEEGLPVRLAYLNGSRVASLYSRNGFELVERTETLSRMERQPVRWAL